MFSRWKLARKKLFNYSPTSSACSCCRKLFFSLCFRLRQTLSLCANALFYPSEKISSTKDSFYDSPIQSPTVIWWPRSLSVVALEMSRRLTTFLTLPTRQCLQLDCCVRFTLIRTWLRYTAENLLLFHPEKFLLIESELGNKSGIKAQKTSFSFSKKDSNFYLWFSCFLSHFSLLRICIQSIIPMNKHFHPIEFSTLFSLGLPFNIQ